MQLGLVTYQIAEHWDVPTILSHCAQTGFAAVELRTTHAHGVELGLSADACAEVRARFADSGVRLWGLGTVCEYHSADPAVVAHNVEETKQWIGLAAQVGARGVKVRPNGVPEGHAPEAVAERIGRALAQVGPAAADAGVLVYLEVHGHVTCDPRLVRIMMETCAHPAVGVCWNSNLHPTEVIDGRIDETFALLAPWIQSVHITELCNAYPWRDLFRLLVASGYTGATLAECAGNPDPLRFMRYYRALWQAYQP